MIEEFNRNASTLALTHKVTGHKADLLSDHVPGKFAAPTFNNFDVLAVSMALHHFEHPDRALQRLGERVKKGGVCFIIDLVAHSGHGHDHEHSHGPEHGRQQHKEEFGDAAHTVKTHGFSRDDMQKLFQGAGFNARFDYEVLPQPVVFTKAEKTISKTVFMARAQRI